MCYWPTYHNLKEIRQTENGEIIASVRGRAFCGAGIVKKCKSMEDADRFIENAVKRKLK